MESNARDKAAKRLKKLGIKLGQGAAALAQAKADAAAAGHPEFSTSL